MSEYEIRVGDALDVLRTLDDEIVQTCITSPPYWGLRDYKADGQIGLEKTPEEYVERLVGVFREVRRVLADDGTLWLNLGDSYATGGNGIGSGKQLTNVGSWMPAKTKPPPGLKPKDLVGIPWRVAFALQADGWYLRSDIIWSKPNPMPESVTDRPTKAHEYLFLLSKSPRYYYDANAIREEAIWGPWNSASSFSANGERARAGFKAWNGAESHPDRSQTGRNRRSVWTIPTQPFPGAHFAVMPQALVEPCILAGSREGDLVLDPFAGAGTVGVVARKHRRRFLGLEINPEFARMARGRLGQDTTAEATSEEMPLFEH